MAKGSIGRAFAVPMRTEHRDEASFYSFAPREVSVLAELALGHLRYPLTCTAPVRLPAWQCPRIGSRGAMARQAGGGGDGVASARTANGGGGEASARTVTAGKDPQAYARAHTRR